MYSEGQIKSILLTPIFTAFLSFLGSATLIYTILRKSTLKLSIPSRRVFFGLCIYDCILSIGQMFSSFPVPVGQALWGGMGNIGTCDAQGFIIHLGNVGSALYNCALSVYYVSVIKFSMSDNAFKRKIEPFLHTLINAYTIFGACFLLSGEYFNSIGNMCWISAVPPSCINDPDEECIRGDEKAYKYRWWFTAYAVAASFVIIPLNMFLIILEVWKQKKKSDRWRLTEESNEGGTPCRIIDSIKRSFAKLTGIFQREKRNSITSKGRRSTSVLSSSVGNKSEYEEVNGREYASILVPVGDSPRPEVMPKSPVTKEKPPQSKKSQRVSFCIHGVDAEDIDEESTSLRSSLPPSISRSGTSEDPYAFNLQKIRKSIRKQSLSSTSTISDNASLRESLRSSKSNLRSHNTRVGISAEREVTKQALLFLSAYLFCWIFTFTGRFVETKDQLIPFPLLMTARVVKPLQGLFNILVYCRPHIRTYRVRNPEISWITAFLKTLENGGDSESVEASQDSSYNSRRRRRRSSGVDKSVMLQRIELEHKKRMASLRKSNTLKAVTKDSIGNISLPEIGDHDDHIVPSTIDGHSTTIASVQTGTCTD